jgi:hypothetical protein
VKANESLISAATDSTNISNHNNSNSNNNHNLGNDAGKAALDKSSLFCFFCIK